MKPSPPDNVPTALWVHGRPQPPVAPILVCAGPLRALFDPATGLLRRIRLGGREVWRGLYAAVRDQNWDTVPVVLSELRMDVGADSFHIEFVARHQQREVEFTWQGTLSGGTDGTIRYQFNGKAGSRFRRNRIGFCLLHPLRECLGASVKVTDVHGRHRELLFPEFVAVEQPMVGFEELSVLTHEVSTGLWGEARFCGDAFETEDQRNWTDASFKTYCTPQFRPKPVEVAPGTVVEQSVELRLLETAPRALEVTIAGPPAKAPCFESVAPVRLPDVGFAEPENGRPLQAAELDRLAALRVCHLRVEADLSTGGWSGLMRRASRHATDLGVPLELVVTVPTGEAATPLMELRRELTRARADVIRVLALEQGRRTTTQRALDLVRTHLGDLEAPIGVGSDADLYQLHQQPPPFEGADFVAWSMNPQVHLFDPWSILETPEGAWHQIRTVAQRHPGIPCVVSPISLKPRFNPGLGRATAPPTPGEWPSNADPRQASLVAAAWTVGMLAALAPSGLESLTCFETVGIRGLMAPLESTEEPTLAWPGAVFPLWHVFAALGGFRTVEPLLSLPGDTFAGFRLRDREGVGRWVVANLTCEPANWAPDVRQPARWRALDERNVRDAMAEPQSFWRREVSSIPITSVGPYGLIFVDELAP